MLIGITGTMVTVIALLLGLAVVALQLSSTQFSPRLCATICATVRTRSCSACSSAPAYSTRPAGSRPRSLAYERRESPGSSKASRASAAHGRPLALGEHRHGSSKAGHLATEARIAPHEPAGQFEIHQATPGSRRDH
jgi:hypothetical protein